MTRRPSVWAPHHARVELTVGRERHSMLPDGAGWWRAAIELPPGTDYQFVLDGGGPLPDPRSPWYRALLRLRRQTPELRDGDRSKVSVRHNPAAGWIVVDRGPATVAANLGSEAVEVSRVGEVCLAWPPDLDTSRSRLHLPPDAVAVMMRA